MRNPFVEEKFDIKKWAKKYIVLIVLFVFTGILATNYFINLSKINKNGVYVLGRVIEVSEYRVNTKCSKYVYFYKEKRYIGEGCGNWDRIGDLYFLKIIPSDPNNHHQLEFTHVPYCLTMDSVPVDGWKVLPLNDCK